MEIAEAMRRLRQLEDRLRAEIVIFESETGVQVTDVCLERGPEKMGRRLQVLERVRLTAHLEGE